MPPVFEFTDHYDTTVEIFGRELPVKIKRYSRAESDALFRRSQELNPRGTATETADIKAETLAFFEEVLTDAVTLDEGVITDRGRSLTTGAELLDLFHNRQDVLAALAAQVIIENRMMPSLAKNSNSPRDTATGSDASIQTSGEPARGGGPGSTATPVALSTTAPIAAATDASSAPAVDAPVSSGEVANAATGVV